MSIAAEAVAKARARPGAAIVPLLALALFINYVDRGNLATVAPLMKDDLRLSAAQIGLLFSVFYWTYIPCQLLAGWLAGRIGAYRTLAMAALAWSLATAVSGLAGGFAVLVVLRLLLGIGESAIFPCSSKLIAPLVPTESIGFANGLVATGLGLGPAFGTFAGGLLMARYGWRATFLAFGLVSLIWLVPWLATTRGAGTRNREGDDGAPGFLAILKRREAWAACIGHFCGNYAFYFVIYWMPLYLVKARGFSVPQMAALGAMIYLIYAASSQATGWLSDRWTKSGASQNRVRKSMILASSAGVALAMLGCAFGDRTVCIASLFVAGIFFGPGSASVFAIGQILAGPRAAGNWVGVQNCLGNISGLVGPLVTGLIVERTGSFFWAFALACAVTLFGMVAWGIMIPKVAPLDWTGETA